MANFGLDELRLVSPRDGWPNEKAVSASANAVHVIDKAQIYDTLENAITDLQFVYATTARPREMVKEVVSPKNAAKSMHEQINQGARVGILFGREKSGLTNDDISFADKIIIAPVDPNCASLNLAQAVLLLAYELRCSENNPKSQETLGRKTQFDGPAIQGTQLKSTHPATKDDLIALFNHLKYELEKGGFFRTVEKTPQMMRNIRNMIIRMQPTDQDVRTLRGIITSLVKGRPNSNKN